MEQRNAGYYKEYLSLRNDVLNAIKKSTHIRCSTVIVGDCSLKLLRQEYFLSKQKEFLTFLAQQWAREQLVILALRLEGRQLDSMIATLKSIAQQINIENKELEQRLVILVSSPSSLMNSFPLFFFKLECTERGNRLGQNVKGT
jgi:hypothetical protein